MTHHRHCKAKRRLHPMTPAVSPPLGWTARQSAALHGHPLWPKGYLTSGTSRDFLQNLHGLGYKPYVTVCYIYIYVIYIYIYVIYIYMLSIYIYVIYICYIYIYICYIYIYVIYIYNIYIYMLYIYICYIYIYICYIYYIYNIYIY